MWRKKNRFRGHWWRVAMGQRRVGWGSTEEGRRGRGGKTEKQSLLAQLLSPRALKSTQESTRKIVTVLFQNYALSGKDTLALFFTSGRNEMWWKFTEGVRTDGGIFPCTRVVHAPCAHADTRMAGGVLRVRDPPPCAQQRRCRLVKKKQMSLLVGQNPPNPNIPNSKNRIKRKDQHLYKPKSGVKQWKNTLAVTNFGFWLLVFAFWISFGAEVCAASLAG